MRKALIGNQSALLLFPLQSQQRSKDMTRCALYSDPVNIFILTRRRFSNF